MASELNHQVDVAAAERITYMNAASYMAAVEGRIDKFKNYQGSLESLRTTNHNTVLHLHLSHGRQGIERFIKPILEICPSLLQQSNDKGQTPLHIVAKKGEYHTVTFLISQSMAQSKRDPEGICEGGQDAVRESLRKMDRDMNTALHLAVQNGHVDVVNALLELEDADFTYSANKSQKTPLYLAVESGNGSVVAAILDKFESATGQGGPHVRTALHAAAMKGDAEITRKIVEKKGKYLTVETDENGHTPLHYAAHLGHCSVVKELLKCDQSASYMADKKWGMIPLLMAARQGHRQIIAEILYHCPDCCEKVDNRGWNLLHFVAVRDGTTAILRWATKIPSFTNLIDEEDVLGITPRHLQKSFPPWGNVFNNEDQITKLLKDVFDDQVADARVRVPRAYNFVSFVDKNKIDKAAEAQLVVAALVATMAFAAALTVPGGYKEHEEGTPSLLHNAAFRAFVISDALAFGFSLSAVCFYFQATLPRLGLGSISMSFMRAFNSILFALIAIAISFSTGTYVVLKATPSLAFASCFLVPCCVLFSLLHNLVYHFEIIQGKSNFMGTKYEGFI